MVLVSALLVACGGAPPSGTGGPGGPANPTPVPPGAPLSARMPAELGGQPMTYVDASGDQATTALQTVDVALLTAAVDDAGKPMSALKVSAGAHASVAVGALSIEGIHWTPGSTLLARTVTALLGPTGRMRVTSETIAGKRLLKITDFEDDTYTAYVYISGQRDTDIAYFARGDAALVEEFFSKIR
jgi:hypothetical protein